MPYQTFLLRALEVKLLESILSGVQNWSRYADWLQIVQLMIHVHKNVQDYKFNLPGGFKQSYFYPYMGEII